MSEKKKNKAAQQEAVTEETASAAQAGAPEQEGQPAAPAEDSTQAVQAALAEKEDQLPQAHRQGKGERLDRSKGPDSVRFPAGLRQSGTGFEARDL